MLDEALLQAIRIGVVAGVDERQLVGQALTVPDVPDAVTAEHFQHLIDIEHIAGKVFRFSDGRELFLIRRITEGGRVALAQGCDLGGYSPAEVCRG